VGLLGLCLLKNLMRSDWGRSTRPLLEAASSTFPLLALLFLPIALGMGRLYSWTDPSALELRPIYHVREWFNPTGFIARAVFYFALWTVLGRALLRDRDEPYVD